MADAPIAEFLLTRSEIEAIKGNAVQRERAALAARLRALCVTARDLNEFLALADELEREGGAEGPLYDESLARAYADERARAIRAETQRDAALLALRDALVLLHDVRRGIQWPRMTADRLDAEVKRLSVLAATPAPGEEGK